MATKATPFKMKEDTFQCEPAQPATASGYLTAHGYTVVQHFSRAEWLAKLTPGTAYAKREGDSLKGTIHLSHSTANIIREASLTLAKK